MKGESNMVVQERCVICEQEFTQDRSSRRTKFQAWVSAMVGGSVCSECERHTTMGDLEKIHRSRLVPPGHA
jgi:hypothetical protein